MNTLLEIALVIGIVCIIVAANIFGAKAHTREMERRKLLSKEEIAILEDQDRTDLQW